MNKIVYRLINIIGVVALMLGSYSSVSAGSALVKTVMSVGPGTYDDRDAAWVYSGSWESFSGAGPYKSTLHIAHAVGDTASFSFDGTSFTFFYTAANDRGKIEVWVDDLLVKTLNAKNRRLHWQTRYISPTFTAGTHNVQIKHAGPTGAYIDLDRIKIYAATSAPMAVVTRAAPENSIPPPATPTPTNTSIPPTATSTTANTSVPPTATATPINTPPTTGSGYFVSPTGSDANPGTQAQPWKTIQKAVTTVASGATVTVMAGSYPEFINLTKSGIRFMAAGLVNMNGFYVWGNDNLISGFTITNPSSDFGIRVTGNNNVVEKNNISNTKQDGIWFFGSGNKFIANYIHDIVDRSLITTDPHVDCFQTWGPAENIVFEKNICNHTNTYGSNQIAQVSNVNTPVRNIVFKNNIFVMHDPGYSPMTFYHMDGQLAISDIYVINNTFVHLDGIGASGIWFKNVAGAYAINNLFIDYGDPTVSYVLVEGGSNINISYNAVYKSDSVAPKGGPFPNDIWMQNPGLANYMNYDFHLLPASPLIDTGYFLGSLVLDDYDGVLRPQGLGYDIGAFEFETP